MHVLLHMKILEKGKDTHDIHAFIVLRNNLLVALLVEVSDV